MTMTELISGDVKARNVTRTHAHTLTHVSCRIVAYTKVEIVKRYRKVAVLLRLEMSRPPSKPYE